MVTPPSHLGQLHICKEPLKKLEGEREKEDGRLHHTKWKANNMHISILRRCTTLLGKTKTKELSDTTVQSILHLSKCLSSSIEMHHSKRKKGKLEQSHSETTDHFVSFLPANSSIWKLFNSMLKIAWKDQTIGRSLSLSRTVTLWRWCSKGVKMGQQAIVGSIQGNVNGTLLKSHTQKKSKRAHV